MGPLQGPAGMSIARLLSVVPPPVTYHTNDFVVVAPRL